MATKKPSGPQDLEVSSKDSTHKLIILQIPAPEAEIEGMIRPHLFEACPTFNMIKTYFDKEGSLIFEDGEDYLIAILIYLAKLIGNWCGVEYHSLLRFASAIGIVDEIIKSIDDLIKSGQICDQFVEHKGKMTHFIMPTTIPTPVIFTRAYLAVIDKKTKKK
jgi:hypothetical protein